MHIIISPDLFVERVDNLFGVRKKLDSKNVRITTDLHQSAAIFQCGARSLGIEAKIHEGGDLVVDAGAVRNVFGVLSRKADVEIFSKYNKAIIKQGSYTVSLDCRSVSEESGRGGTFMDEKYDILQKEKRRLLHEIKKIDEQLKGCARIVRKR